jgi:hypothetical protein
MLWGGMYYERISHMTDSEAFEQVGRKRAEYRQRKTELAQLKVKAGDLAKYAATISRGLEHPEMIRWWEGTPNPGLSRDHILFTPAMFAELTEQNVKRLCDDFKRVEAALGALRDELKSLDEDPER